MAESPSMSISNIISEVMLWTERGGPPLLRLNRPSLYKMYGRSFFKLRLDSVAGRIFNPGTSEEEESDSLGINLRFLPSALRLRPDPIRETLFSDRLRFIRFLVGTFMVDMILYGASIDFT